MSTTAAEPRVKKQSKLTSWIRPKQVDSEGVTSNSVSSIRQTIKAQSTSTKKDAPARKASATKTVSTSAPPKATHQRLAQRRKWIKKKICFSCHEECNGKLTPCQCFQKSGVQGKGMMFCQDCELELDCCGICDQLCCRSCNYASCDNCGDNHCRKCTSSGKAKMEKCSNCKRKYCCVGEEEGDIPKFLRCSSCGKKGCTECRSDHIKECEFCLEVLFCDDCQDPRQDPIDGHCCSSCLDNAGSDPEDAAIRKYGADYEDYW